RAVGMALPRAISRENQYTARLVSANLNEYTESHSVHGMKIGPHPRRHRPEGDKEHVSQERVVRGVHA
ncbi:hypothetical protein KPA97_66095, partial [Burkholderia cenocepacia]|nr:hypothetical protein [Burkholderia cenocepacia]MDR5670877.1 hypothetical protein [Burkholderia cenocepacia]